MQKGNASLMVGASSWKDQFVEAFTVQAGGDDEEEEEGGDEEGITQFYLILLNFTQFYSILLNFTQFTGEGEEEEKMPTCGDYIMHFLTLFWKIIFAFIPPAGNF